MKAISAGLSLTGEIRTNNEDNFYIDGYYKEDYRSSSFAVTCSEDRDCHVYAVCDGMGGYEFGEKAAWQTLKLLRSFDNEDIEKNLKAFVLHANREVCRSYTGTGSEKRGTTLALVTIMSDRLTCCNVGDSRVYLYRKKRLERISEDHTRAQSMINAGIMSEKDAESRRDLRVLNQYIGVPEDDFIISPEIKSGIPLLKGDIIILCSDGLTDMVSDVEIGKTIKKSRRRNPELIGGALAREAMVKGGRDNITAVVVKIEK